ncbi:hypothetical protein [Vibrio breoganii]|uniref:hypothetical protein n=1 Tax=Vibrio breoganii TaxID=553239 RepID=UPI000C8569DD|nr:hypothetical protein [Vibrio breoganii]PMG88732.1 hypothetical protein BCU80_17100 [Vibrio breoganii]
MKLRLLVMSLSVLSLFGCSGAFYDVDYDPPDMFRASNLAPKEQPEPTALMKRFNKVVATIDRENSKHGLDKPEVMKANAEVSVTDIIKIQTLSGKNKDKLSIVRGLRARYRPVLDEIRAKIPEDKKKHADIYTSLNLMPSFDMRIMELDSQLFRSEESLKKTIASLSEEYATLQATMAQLKAQEASLNTLLHSKTSHITEGQLQYRVEFITNDKIYVSIKNLSAHNILKANFATPRSYENEMGGLTWYLEPNLSVHDQWGNAYEVSLHQLKHLPIAGQAELFSYFPAQEKFTLKPGEKLLLELHIDPLSGAKYSVVLHHNLTKKQRTITAF